jgi:hypothetical protein
MLKYGQAYVDKGTAYYEEKYRQHQLKWLQKQAAALNLQIIPSTGVVSRVSGEEPQAVLSIAKEESRIAMKMRRARFFASLRMTQGMRFSAAC